MPAARRILYSVVVLLANQRMENCQGIRQGVDSKLAACSNTGFLFGSLGHWPEIRRRHTVEGSDERTESTHTVDAGSIE